MVDVPVNHAHPLLPDELQLVERVMRAVAHEAGPDAITTIATIRDQLESLRRFGELWRRYPSPLGEQQLGERRRGLDTLIGSLVATDAATFPFRAPTQALVGRAMNMAQINFLRLLWHVAGSLRDAAMAAQLREQAAHALRAGVYCRLVEEVLAELITDAAVPRPLRELGVRHLAQLWGDRLTWRAHRFFPLLAATWEARQRVRVTGGTLAGNCEMFQLLAAGGEPDFVSLLVDQDHGEAEVLAFREFLFGTSSEELDRLAKRMADEGLSSIELDSRPGEADRDAGSLLFEFFRQRMVLCGARRAVGMPGPRHTAEGYVLLGWLARQ